MAPILLLDVMDTLVYDPWRELPDFFGLSLSALLEAKHPTAWQDFERGELDEARFLLLPGLGFGGCCLDAMNSASLSAVQCL